MVSLPTQAERGYLAEIDEQLKDELNLKSVKDAGEAGGVFRYDVRPNFAALGPKYGPDVPSIVRQLAAMDAADVARSVESGHDIRLEDHTLLPSEVLVTRAPEEGYSVASEGGYTVAVSTEVSPELALEGLARELVHRIQNMRRSAEFDIADRIITYYQGGDGLDEVMDAHGGFIREETLSRRLVDGQPALEAYTEDHTIDGLDVTLAVVRD